MNQMQPRKTSMQTGGRGSQIGNIFTFGDHVAEATGSLGAAVTGPSICRSTGVMTVAHLLKHSPWDLHLGLSTTQT